MTTTRMPRPRMPRLGRHQALVLKTLEELGGEATQRKLAPEMERTGRLTTREHLRQALYGLTRAEVVTCAKLPSVRIGNTTVTEFLYRLTPLGNACLQELNSGDGQ